MSTPDWLRYANAGATRSRPLSPDLVNRLGYLGNMGVTMEVFSGGQPSKAEGGPRVGSTRHDHGNAADVLFYKDGRRLDWANEQDRPIFQNIVSQGKQAGITGFGAGDGYMRPGSIHVGLGNPGVWGAGGSGASAPNWLRSAFDGSSPPLAPEPKPTPAANALPPITTVRNVTDRPVAPIQEAAPQAAPVPVPDAVAASANPTTPTDPLNFLGSLAAMQPAPEVQPPPPVQGPSPQQAQALSSFIEALRKRQIA